MRVRFSRLRSRATLIGAAVSVVLAAGAAFPPEPVHVAQLVASDFAFARTGGPGLGQQPDTAGIVLVIEDNRTRAALGNLARSPDVADVPRDLALYQALLEGGAVVVADTRRLLGDTPEMQALLDGLAALDTRGRVLRDAWAELKPWYASRADLYRPHIAHSVYQVAGLDESQEVRFDPMLTAFQGQLAEGMALRVARLAIGADPNADPSDPALSSGIAAAWLADLGLSAPDNVRQSSAQRPYPLATGYGVPWVLRPFRVDPATVSPASLWINYTLASDRLTRFAYVDVLQGAVPRAALQGKVVIVGSDADLFAAPLSSVSGTQAAVIFANAVETILGRRYLQPASAPLAFAITLLLGLLAVAAVARLRPLPSGVALAMLLVASAALAVGMERLGLFPDLVVAPLAIVASGVAVGAQRYGGEERTRRHIQDLFGRYVPRPVVDQLIAQPGVIAAIGGTKREITVLFADIRGFTPLSERLPADEVLPRLNRLLDAMVTAVFAHEGTVDKFIGDAVMVLFNAPVSQPDHTERAVRAALDMQRAAAAVGGELRVGIGINCGEAVVGNVGSAQRMEYTAIGSTVNLASRLCDVAAAGEIVISDAVHARVAGLFRADPRPPARVKGFDRDIGTYLVRAEV